MSYPLNAQKAIIIPNTGPLVALLCDAETFFPAVVDTVIPTDSFLLGHDTASLGNRIPAFGENELVLSSRVKMPKNTSGTVALARVLDDTVRESINSTT